MRNRLWLVFACLLAVGTVGSAQTPPLDPAAALRQKQAALDLCHAKIGEQVMLVESIETQIQNGTISATAATAKRVTDGLVAIFEKANEGKTLDAKTGKISDKVKEAGK